MEKYKRLFHYLSFIQYPFLLIGLYYSYKPLLFDDGEIWNDFNFCLTFIGIGISFSSLADISRKSKLSKKLFRNKKFIKGFFIYLIILVLIIMASGIFCLFFTKIKPLNDLAIGILVFGIGVIGILRMTIEAVEINNESTTANTV